VINDRVFLDEFKVHEAKGVLLKGEEKSTDFDLPWPAIRQARRYAKQVAVLEFWLQFDLAAKVELAFEIFKRQFDFDAAYTLAQIFHNTHWTWADSLQSGAK
jgi:hypothetical protein